MEKYVSLVPLPSPESLQYRANLSRIFFSLRMVHPRVPFWKLAAHRVPTLWTLYRGLLREAPTYNIRWRMQMYFRFYRHITSPKETRIKLQTAHKWLDTLCQAHGGNEHLQKVLLRYDKMITSKIEKERMKQMLREAWAFREQLRRRPILTGGYIRASLYNKPLPRMKPQPEHISMMIRSRRLARERRGARYALLTDWHNDANVEARFEEELAAKASKEGKVLDDVFRNSGFRDMIKEEQRGLRETFNRDIERLTSPITDSLREIIRNARREKTISKTRERLLERKGVVTRRYAKRLRKMPPPDVYRKLTPERRRMDRVARSISEVGYVRDIKQKLGFKLKDNTTWMQETGDHWTPERRNYFEDLERKIQLWNEEKRSKAENSGGEET